MRPLSLDIADAFTKAGARVVTASLQREAMITVEEIALSTAVLDHVLKDGDSLRLFARLKERNIPFVPYSGYSNLDGTHGDAVYVEKPASTDVLLTTVVGLLAGRVAL
jgi:DNA-binding NtrC family response regulator